jgi:hypothetical protein
MRNTTESAYVWWSSLPARFDEQANIAWSERLTEAGIEVIFGIPGLKVHSKLFLIDRIEQGNWFVTVILVQVTSTKKPPAFTRTLRTAHVRPGDL